MGMVFLVFAIERLNGDAFVHRAQTGARLSGSNTHAAKRRPAHSSQRVISASVGTLKSPVSLW